MNDAKKLENEMKEMVMSKRLTQEKKLLIRKSRNGVVKEAEISV